MTHVMSDSDKTDGQAELAVKPKTKQQRPPMYKVLMLNDDFTRWNSSSTFWNACST